MVPPAVPNVDEKDEGKMLDGVVRIVGDGKRALGAADGGWEVMLFEWYIGGLTGSARGRLPIPAVLDLTPDIGRTLGILLVCVESASIDAGLEER